MPDAEPKSCIGTTERSLTVPAPITRLAEAINSHDPARIADAFTADYECEMPMHPSRGFTGSDAVRASWTAIIDRVPDLAASVTRWAQDGDLTWSEWEMLGTTPDATPVIMRGVVIATAPAQGLISHTRFYLDPVTDA